MQNRYVGDIGDYGKYALLRSIEKTGLKLGVNWYLAPDESHNADGKHISYLCKQKYKKYDDELYSILKDIVDRGTRDVRFVQESGALSADTIFFNSVLDMSRESNYIMRRMIRADWHEAALGRLKECDIVFLDPDNGLQVKSKSLTGKIGNKYIAIDELKDYCRLEKSVIFYNHRSRQVEQDYLKRFKALSEDPAFSGYTWTVLKYVKGTIRDYFLIIHPRHLNAIRSGYNGFLDTSWKDFFSKFNF